MTEQSKDDQCYFANSSSEGLDGTTDCEPVDGDDYCHGCHKFICSNHAIYKNRPDLAHGHMPTDHIMYEGGFDGEWR